VRQPEVKDEFGCSPLDVFRTDGRAELGWGGEGTGRGREGILVEAEYAGGH